MNPIKIEKHAIEKVFHGMPIRAKSEMGFLSDVSS